MKIYRTTINYRSGTSTHSYSDSPRAYQLAKAHYRWGNPHIFASVTLSVAEVPDDTFEWDDTMEITGD